MEFLSCEGYFLIAVNMIDSMSDAELTTNSSIRLEVEDILDHSEHCQRRTVPEETWSDLVVHPTLQLARRICQHTNFIYVIDM